MKTRGWRVVGMGSATSIKEATSDVPDETLVKYDEAKTMALKKLHDEMESCLARIRELEEDYFLETGALPPFRAWKRLYGPQHVVVTAKIKERARRLAGATRIEFEESWEESTEDWWHELAQEEAVWIEEQDDRKQGTGVFYKPLDGDEGKQILNEHIAPYRTIGFNEVLAQVDQTSTVTGVSSQGTPYKVTITVRYRDWCPKHYFFIDADINDYLGWKWIPTVSLERVFPEADTTDWNKEGF